MLLDFTMKLAKISTPLYKWVNDLDRVKIIETPNRQRRYYQRNRILR